MIVRAGLFAFPSVGLPRFCWFTALGECWLLVVFLLHSSTPLPPNKSSSQSGSGSGSATRPQPNPAQPIIHPFIHIYPSKFPKRNPAQPSPAPYHIKSTKPHHTPLSRVSPPKYSIPSQSFSPPLSDFKLQISNSNPPEPEPESANSTPLPLPRTSSGIQSVSLPLPFPSRESVEYMSSVCRTCRRRSRVLD